MKRLILAMIVCLAMFMAGGCADDTTEPEAEKPAPAAEQKAEQEAETPAAPAEEPAAPAPAEEPKAETGEIKIGVISDLSGATSSVGTPYADGIMDAVRYINEQGGIAGRTIKALQVDYAYDVQQALTAYKRFKNEGIVALQGWGTGDTEALTGFVGKDEIPTLSASYSAHLTDPSKAPYNFFNAADYSTQMRAALKYLRENWDQERAPRVAFVYPDHPYGLSPIAAGKEYAEELGFEIVGEENVSLKATDATTQLLRLQKTEPDYVWIGGTTPSAAVIMKDAKKLQMDVTFFINIWGADEDTFKLAGDAANGHLSLQTATVYNDDTPGNELIRKITNGEYKMTHYIRGFSSMLTMAEGIRIAAEKGEITGPAIKDALETLRDYDPMGLTPPISFYADDHRPNMAVKLYRLQDGDMELVTTESLERKKEWLGK
jgi:branched-chain amino acid transport system substrate-binding protein